MNIKSKNLFHKLKKYFFIKTIIKSLLLYFVFSQAYLYSFIPFSDKIEEKPINTTRIYSKNSNLDYEDFILKAGDENRDQLKLTLEKIPIISARL